MEAKSNFHRKNDFQPFSTLQTHSLLDQTQWKQVVCLAALCCAEYILAAVIADFCRTSAQSYNSVSLLSHQELVALGVGVQSLRATVERKSRQHGSLRREALDQHVRVSYVVLHANNETTRSTCSILSQNSARFFISMDSQL